MPCPFHTSVYADLNRAAWVAHVHPTALQRTVRQGERGLALQRTIMQSLGGPACAPPQQQCDDRVVMASCGALHRLLRPGIGAAVQDGYRLRVAAKCSVAQCIFT